MTDDRRAITPLRPARGRSGRASALLVLALLVLGALVLVSQRRDDAVVRTRLSLDRALGTGDNVGHALALEPRPFVFPDDHGAHSRFATEWWYLTGQLETTDGRRFGYQLTLFRSALSPDSVARASAWATAQAWMAHFAVTDVEAQAMHAFERFARGAAGLAGATADPFRVWLEDWEIRTDDAVTADDRAGEPAVAVSDDPVGGDQRGRESAAAIFPVRVRAREGGIAIDLVVRAGKPIVLHGDSGLSRKGVEPGNASYYYSFTRLPTAGRILIGRDTAVVSGQSWFDREWSTSQLGAGVEGWDWFALQLEDGVELMAFRLRRQDGTDALRGGTSIDAGGNSRTLAPDDVVLEPTGTWASPIDGAAYPARWSVHVPADTLRLDIVPLLPGQELDLAVRYWEGAVSVTGTRGGRPVRGRGYLEMTGYAGEAAVRAR